MRLGKVLTSVVFGSLLLACNLTLYRTHAYAQEYPSRNVTIIVPFPAGGGNDIFARLIGQRLAAAFGRTVIVDNRPGASGNIGAEAVVRAAPDGHTILYGNANVATTQVVPPKPAFDPQRDLAPVSMTVLIPFVLVAHPSLPVRNVKDLVELARSKPGGLTFGSQGVGSGGHVLGEMLRMQTGAPFVHVPYRGAGPAVTDLSAGNIDLLFSSYASAIGQVQGGKLRVIRWTAPKRSPTLPDVPTMTDAGYPGVELVVWHGIMAPLGTPPEIVKKLNEEFTKAALSPDVVQKAAAQGVEMSTTSPEEFAKLIAADFGNLGKVIRDAGIKMQ